MEKKFTQLCVWQGTTLGGTTPEEFEVDMEGMFGAKFKFDSIQVTKPIPNREGGRSDLFFYVQDGYPMSFPVERLKNGIRWWEDVLLNGNGHLYSQEFLDAHPKTW